MQPALPNEVVQIDSLALEIDTTFDGDFKDWQQLLEKSISAQMKETLHSIKDEGQGVASISMEQSEANAVFVFLETGNKPWWYSQEQRLELRFEVLEKHLSIPSFRYKLMRLLLQDVALKRFVYQLSYEEVKASFEILYPENNLWAWLHKINISREQLTPQKAFYFWKLVQHYLHKASATEQVDFLVDLAFSKGVKELTAEPILSQLWIGLSTEHDFLFKERFKSFSSIQLEIIRSIIDAVNTSPNELSTALLQKKQLLSEWTAEATQKNSASLNREHATGNSTTNIESFWITFLSDFTELHGEENHTSPAIITICQAIVQLPLGAQQFLKEKAQAYYDHNQKERWLIELLGGYQMVLSTIPPSSLK